MVQVPPGFREVHMFNPGSEWLRIFIGDLRIIFAQVFQDEVGDIFYLVFPLFLTTNIIDFSRLEIINYIGKGAAGIFNVIEDAPVTEINGVGLIF